MLSLNSSYRKFREILVAVGNFREIKNNFEANQ